MNKLQQTVEKLSIERYSRHVLLCVGDGCCGNEEGKKSWKALKDELKKRDLVSVDSKDICYRTKVDCLRVCMQGPIVVVYPEGYWYAKLTQDKIPEFVERQIVEGKPIEDWIFAKNSSISDAVPKCDAPAEQ